MNAFLKNTRSGKIETTVVDTFGQEVDVLVIYRALRDELSPDSFHIELGAPVDTINGMEIELDYQAEHQIKNAILETL